MQTTANKHDYQGLTLAEVEQSRANHGSNKLSPPVKISLWVKFFEKFKDPIIVILLVAMCLSFATSYYDYFVTHEDTTGAGFIEPLGVLITVILATVVAFYFELKSEKEFEILNQVNEEVYYKALREGKVVQVVKNDIVVGDILLLETGEEIPADATLLEAVSLYVDESSLTGEPLATKSTHPEDFDQEATYATNFICRGTTIMDGHCVCQVERVGDATEYGKVFEGAQIDNSVVTPLNRQLDGLSRLITKVSYALAILVLVGSAVAYGMDGSFSNSWSTTLSYFLNKIMIAVTVIVVAVPEGLPMSVSLSLAYSMRSMMKTNNLVRKMHACETMGAATVICTDKTGTLTQNKMTIAETAFVAGVADTLIYESMAVNSTAYLEEESNQVLGNPTEGALLLWLQERGGNYLTMREAMPVISQLTFSTERKYMATVVRSVALGAKVVFVKGAPEIVMGLCSLSAEQRSQYDEVLLSYQQQAMRTIAFAYRILSEDEEGIHDNKVSETELTFVGVVGIADPIRTEVPEAIRECMQAGIQVKIVTGDTPGTAKEIGRQIGLWDDSCTERNLITGVEFASLSDEALRSRISEIRIMSRARPLDKERLVRLLQEAGEVVAVTGDGTNDAPALNRAHVGLSMGDGTSVAKEASDITILDNSFSSITQAVMWGRSLYLNIQRFILFQMTINVVACIIVLLGSFLDAESPLTVTQMLWVNLIMDTLAALALASLPPSKRVMKNKPRKPTDNIISPSMAKRIFGVGGFFVVLLFGLIQYFRYNDLSDIRLMSWGDYANSFFDFRHIEGGLTPYELSLFFSIFVFLQFWNMFNAKAFLSGRSAFAYLDKSKNFLFIALVIILGQVLITTLAYDFFRVAPLPLSSWGVIILSTSVVLVLGELIHLLTRRSE